MTSPNNEHDGGCDSSGSPDGPRPNVPDMPQMNATELLDTGQVKLCPACERALIPPEANTCRQCAHTPPAHRPDQARKPKPKRKKTLDPPLPDVATVITDTALASLSAYDNHTLWLVVAGNPVTQGSMEIRYGKIRHQNSPALMEWRNNITKEALRLTEGKWSKLDAPVALDVVFTLPFGKLPTDLSAFSTPDGDPRIPPMLPPDVDKLLRAVQDSLSPRDNKLKAETTKTRDRRFLLLQDDSRIIDSSSRKTFPRPRHTHPWALDYPGAVIRVAPIGADIPPLPHSTLTTPGDLPVEVHEIEKAVRRRTAPRS